MELQEKICRKRDDISSLRAELSDVRRELDQAIIDFKEIRSECNHTYAGSYQGQYQGTTALDSDVCEICEEWE